MIESLELFKSLLISKSLTKSAFFLIFTKIDLFREKIIHDPMEHYFPEYNGGSDFSNALEYWIQRFDNVKPHPQSQLHIQLAASTASFKDNIMEMHDLMPAQLSIARSHYRRRTWSSAPEALVDTKPKVETPPAPPCETGWNLEPKDMRGMVTHPQNDLEAIGLAL